MIINEDYFKDIELTDEEIYDGDDDNNVNDNFLNSRDYELYLIKKYQKCIIISTNFDTNNIFNNKIWNSYIPNMIKRTTQVLDIYNTEYEIVMRDYSRDKFYLNCYEVGKYKIYSSKEESDFFNKSGYNKIFIIFYCNFPDFTYKQSYNFVDRFQNVIWKTGGKYLFDDMTIIKEPCTLSAFTVFYNLYIDCATLKINREKHDSKISKKLPYKSFFTPAILSFHSDDNDYGKVIKMYIAIENNRDPFAKET